MLLGATAPALAQEQASATEASGEMQTVIVSARKREESIAEVPTSITAFTSETIKDYNIQSFSDYATKTPNMSFTYGGGPTGFADARTISIRGITGQNLFGTAGATGFYIDDTPVPGPSTRAWWTSPASKSSRGRRARCSAKAPSVATCA